MWYQFQYVRGECSILKTTKAKRWSFAKRAWRRQISFLEEMYKLNLMLLNLLHLCIIHSETLINYCHVYWFLTQCDRIMFTQFAFLLYCAVHCWLSFISCLDIYLPTSALIRQRNKRFALKENWNPQQWVAAYLMKSGRAVDTRSGRMLENIFHGVEFH